MSLYLMADSDLEEYKALEERAIMVDAAAISAAIGSPAPMTVDGDTATIQIRGMLTPERIGFLDFFGKAQTVYGDITEQLNQAVALGKTKAILETDSGGGNVDGMFEAMDEIATSPLQITGRIVGQAQSAAFMLLSQAKTIESTRPYNFIGSVGVKTGVSDAQEISNSDSPHKVAGAKTESGKYAAQETLDDVYSMILPRMASGRNTTIGKINSDWGKGATLTAKTALARGMIDMINEPKKAGGSGITKGKAMNKEQLKAEHPDLYASVLAEGKEIGKSEFKKVASSHAKLAEMSGDYARAMADISEGLEADSVCAVYHAGVAQKRVMVDARQGDAPDAIADGKDPVADALAPEAKDDENVLANQAKAFYAGKVIHV